MRVVLLPLAAITLLAFSLGACVGDSNATSNDAGADSAVMSEGGPGDAGGGDATNDTSCNATSCGTACVDIQTNAQNCGACGHACGTSFMCTGGHCGNDVTDVAAGGNHACVLLRDKTVACWGYNATGQTGTDPSNADDTCGIVKCRATPTRVAGLDNIVQVGLGVDFGCAVRNDGAVLCWGNNASGQLARPLSVPYAATPAPIGLPAGRKGAKVTCGSTSACVRTLSNEVYCWGSNVWSEAGLPSSANVLVPSLVTFSAADVTDVAISYDSAARQHACAIRSDKTVWCWGGNLNNELGHPGGGAPMCSDASYTGSCDPTPQVVSGLTGAISIAVGPSSTCAISDQGATCVGSNGFNQLGASSPANVFVPTVVAGLPAPDAGAGALLSIYEGRSEEFALDGNHDLLAWGVNTSGQVGTGNTDGAGCAIGSGKCAVPTKTLSNVSRVSAGYAFGLALQLDGKVMAWGANDEATLGHLPQATGSGDVLCGGSACNPTPKAMTNLP